jgi:hypothetical protein
LDPRREPPLASRIERQTHNPEGTPVAKKNSPKESIVLTVDRTRPDTFGSHAIVVSIGILDPDNGYRVLCPEVIGGLYARELEWRFWRFNRAENRGTPRILDADVVRANYHRPAFVDIMDAEHMVRTLKTVSKCLQAQRDKYGYTEEFAEYVLRIAAAVGADRIAISWDLYTEATGDVRHPHAEGDWVFQDSGLARDILGAVARVDVTARCRECRCPIADGWTHCADHAHGEEIGAVQ